MASHTESPRKGILVCYHAQCSDGFGAAWAAWRKFGEAAEYLPCSYADKVLPDVAGREVYILDFSFPPDKLAQLEAQAASITLLDHHASAQKAFRGYQPQCNCRIHFDMSQSGAALAWRHFHPAEPMPYLIRAVQSRDLWQWNVPNDRAFLASLDMEPMTFEAWERVHTLRPLDREAFIARGQPVVDMLRAQWEDIAREARPVVIGDQQGLMVNAPALFTSDVGNLLSERCGTFALVWQDRGAEGIKCGLRASDGYECMSLAVAMGGGGHPKAASFHLPPERIGELLEGHIRLEGGSRRRVPQGGIRGFLARMFPGLKPALSK